MSDDPIQSSSLSPVGDFGIEAGAEPGIESPVVLTPLTTRRPWGPWATIGWTALCLVVMVLVQNVIAIAVVLVHLAREGPNARRFDPATDGNLIGMATLASTPVVIALVSLLIWIRSYPLRDYLALHRPRSGRAVLSSVVGLLALLFISDATSFLLGRPIVPQVMISAYQTSWPPLLGLAVLVAAPLGEETIMRGFLFKGIAESRWGPSAAIVLSSLAWALIHVQYDLYGIGTIFVMGLYLGVIRHRTGSMPLTVVLHGIANGVATAELIIQVEWLNG